MHHLRPRPIQALTVQKATNSLVKLKEREVMLSELNGGGGSGCYSDATYFEPRDEVKGDVARLFSTCSPVIRKAMITTLRMLPRFGIIVGMA